MFLGLTSFVGLITAVAAGIVSLLPWFTFWPVFSTFAVAIVIVMAAQYLKTSIKTIHDFPNKGDFHWHLAAWRFRFYDNSLNTRVGYARHALAIDETRKDFARVPWATPGDWPARPGEPEWLQQVWFAGNHSDIGGSYAEDESRLSDISLQWMVEQVNSLPHPLQVDWSKLHIFPDAGGMQHSEVESMRDSYPWLSNLWAEEPREVNVQAPLHHTVLARFALPSVLHYGLLREYRPTNLSSHTKLAQFFNNDPEAST
jgi:hypothetical protein